MPSRTFTIPTASAAGLLLSATGCNGHFAQGEWAGVSMELDGQDFPIPYVSSLGDITYTSQIYLTIEPDLLATFSVVYTLVSPDFAEPYTYVYDLFGTGESNGAGVVRIPLSVDGQLIDLGLDCSEGDDGDTLLCDVWNGDMFQATGGQILFTSR